MSWQFRKMQEEDLEAVLIIEDESFSEPWERESFVSEIQHDSFVAVKGSNIAGYLCAWLVMDECIITNIAVAKNARRQGVALFMLTQLFETMSLRGIRCYYLEVRESNIAAISLYNKLGFQKIGLRKDYYRTPIEHAIVMTLDCKGKELDGKI